MNKKYLFKINIILNQKDHSIMITVIKKKKKNNNNKIKLIST